MNSLFYSLTDDYYCDIFTTVVDLRLMVWAREHLHNPIWLYSLPFSRLANFLQAFLSLSFTKQMISVDEGKVWIERKNGYFKPCPLSDRAFYMRTPAQGNLLLRSMREARRVGQDKSSLLDCMDLLFYIARFSYSIKESGIERVIYIVEK